MRRGVATREFRRLLAVVPKSTSTPCDHRQRPLRDPRLGQASPRADVQCCARGRPRCPRQDGGRPRKCAKAPRRPVSQILRSRPGERRATSTFPSASKRDDKTQVDDQSEKQERVLCPRPRAASTRYRRRTPRPTASATREEGPVRDRRRHDPQQRSTLSSTLLQPVESIQPGRQSLADNERRPKKRRENVHRGPPRGCVGREAVPDQQRQSDLCSVRDCRASRTRTSPQCGPDRPATCWWPRRACFWRCRGSPTYL